MKNKHSFLKTWLTLITALMLALMIGCKDSPTDMGDNVEPTTDKEAMQKMADEDSSVSSFDENYDEEEVMAFLNVDVNIFPIRIGHKVRIVSKNLSIDVKGDSAIGTLTINYEGVLLIAAAYSDSSNKPDTLIQKPFASVVTRKLIFVKIANTDRPFRNWKLAAVSLTEGGTLSANIDIKKLTISIAGRDDIVIESPNNFFLNRGMHRWRELPVLNINQEAKITVEVKSAYQEDDIVTLTFGADKKGFHRAKKRFVLVSSTPDGNGFYLKVYEQTYQAHQFPGFYHAVINAFPRQVIFDESAAVEYEMWGIPYVVKF